MLRSRGSLPVAPPTSRARMVRGLCGRRREHVRVSTATIALGGEPRRSVGCIDAGDAQAASLLDGHEKTSR